jgi:cell division septum initiation protein DivIVA
MKKDKLTSLLIQQNEDLKKENKDLRKIITEWQNKSAELLSVNDKLQQTLKLLKEKDYE